MAYRLFTTWFESKDSYRQSELEFCLATNAGAFDSVSVLADSVLKGPEWFDGRWAMIHGRQSYYDVIGGTHIVGADVDDVIVIANADITIPRCELDKINQSIQPSEAYALTRWDITKNHGIRLFDSPEFSGECSQDSWIFRGPPKLNIGGDYFFGTPGCDNRLSHELDAAGYTVLNPSRDIRTYHIHLSGHRTSNTPENRVSLPYLFVEPHKLGEQPKYHRPTKASKRASQYQV